MNFTVYFTVQAHFYVDKTSCHESINEVRRK